MWDASLRKAMEYQIELKRTVNHQLKYNIGVLYNYNDMGKKDLILYNLNEITKGLKLDLQVSKFSVELKKVTKEVNFFLDAFYAKKPLYENLLNFVVLKLHKTIRRVVNQFWNKNWAELNANEVVGLMNAIWFYESVINYWGVTDTKFSTWTNPLIKTFVTKLFENCKKLITSILYDLRNEYQIESGKILSKMTDNIAAHINMIFGHFEQVQVMLAAELLTGLAGNVFMLFLSNVRSFLREENFPLQIYIGIYNNGLMRVIKNFQKMVHSSTKNQISIKQVRIAMDEDFLINTTMDITDMCHNKILKYFKGQIDKKFNDGKIFLEYDLKGFLKKNLQNVLVYINYIESPTALKELMNVVFSQVIINYLFLFLQFAKKVRPENFQTVVQKLKTDKRIFEQELNQSDAKDKDALLFKFCQLQDFLTTDDVDLAIIAITNITVFYKEFNDPKNIDTLLKAKVFFPPRGISYLSKYFRHKLKPEKRKSSFFGLPSLFKKAPVNPFIFLFIKKLSSVIRTSSCQKKTVRRRRQKRYRSPGSSIQKPCLRETTKQTKLHLLC